MNEALNVLSRPKTYAPVTDFERATSYCPLYLAWHILDEARDYFRAPIAEAYADKLARRAEAYLPRIHSASVGSNPSTGAKPSWRA